MSSRLKRELFIKSKMMQVPISGTFELTKRCNLNCKMCYIHDQIPEEEIKADTWIRLGKQACQEGMLYLLLTGGEPFTRKDFSYIYEELVQMGLKISINTNGILLDEVILQTFEKFPPEMINLTLYGASEETYQRLCGYKDGYRIVRKNLKRLKEADIPVSLNTTFTRFNIHEMQALTDIAKEEGVAIRTAAYLFPSAEGMRRPVFSKEGDSFLLDASAGNLSEPVALTPEEMGIAIARFEKMTLPEAALERRRSYIRSILADMNSEADKSMKQVTKQSDKEILTGSRCMAGCSAFWISHDGKIVPCGMMREGVSAIEEGFEQAWKKISEKAKHMTYPEACLRCKKKRICPFCQAVYGSLEKDIEKVRSWVCSQTFTYLKEMGLG